jgi:flagellar basal-body rod protein FlgG
MDAIVDTAENVNNIFSVSYKTKHMSFHETMNGIKATELRDFNSSVPRKTDRELDFAIEGSGFFEVLMPDGTTAYTRNGSLQLSPDGTLLSPQGYPVTSRISDITDSRAVEAFYDESGNLIKGKKFDFQLASSAIKVPAGESVSISSQGDLTTSHGELAGKLALYTFPNLDGFKDIGNGLFIATEQSGKAGEVTLGDMSGETQIKQGYLETSNSNIVKSMSDMLQLNSAIKADLKVIKALDQMQESLNSTITRNI